MDSCIAMEELRTKLINALNSSGLSIGAAFFILRDVYHVLNESYQAAYQKELKDRELMDNISTEEIPLVTEKEVTENGEQNND